jgi:hypothetical protein
MLRVREALFGWKRVPPKPIEQPVRGRSDDVQLREMKVGINETGRDEASAEVMINLARPLLGRQDTRDDTLGIDDDELV